MVWLPHFLSPQKSGQLGRLLKISYLLERDRLDDYATNLSADDRIRVRHQLQAQLDNLTSQLTVALQQLYGISRADESTIGSEVGEQGHVLSLLPAQPPDFKVEPGLSTTCSAWPTECSTCCTPSTRISIQTGNRKPITIGELRSVLGWITKAQEDGSQRVVVDRNQLALVKRIVHPLELGEVSDGPLNLTTDWRRRIDQYAGKENVTGDFAVEDIRRWIGGLGYTGLDKPVANLIIATYALLSDRAWLYNGGPIDPAPELERIGAGHALRAQELPTADEFAAARRRAAALFGLHVPESLFARNANRLANAVRDKAAELEFAVNGVHGSLQKHAASLGVTAQHGRAKPRAIPPTCWPASPEHTTTTPLLRELSSGILRRHGRRARHSDRVGARGAPRS